MASFQNSETVIDSLVTLGGRVRQRRKASGLRIDDAAAFCGVSVDLLSRLENGRSGISTRKLLKVLDGLGLALTVVEKDEPLRPGCLDAASRVGALEYESLEQRFSFSYAPEWLAAKNAYSISPHIPLKGPTATSNTVRRFVENLLPEGRALDIVSTTYQVSRNNICGLIRELGQETSGALSFRSDDALARTRNERPEVTREELAEREQLPFAVWDGRACMSIAGYQDKLAVYLQDKHLYLVDGELASTHILKPEPQDERLETRRERALLHDVGCAPRAGSGGGFDSAATFTRARHQSVRSDIGTGNRAQIAHHRLVPGTECPGLVQVRTKLRLRAGRAGIREGVSFSRLFSVAEYTIEKAVTRLALVRWALFQYLIGNSDADGKNASFLCGPAGLALAPFYDLVSVVQYPHVTHELAMAFGDEFVIENVRPYDFAKFAQQSGTPRSLLAREMRRMAKAATAGAAGFAEREVYLEDEKPLVRNIAQFVVDQAGRLAEMAGAMLRVEAGSL